MNEDRKKGGLSNGKFLTMVVIGALFIGSGNTMATQVVEGNLYRVAEQQQSITVTGVIVDANGEPVIGASVVEKGTTNGGITDIDGRFRISVKTGSILQISYVGYKSQEIKATPNMKIILIEDSEQLNEVIVVGYGQQKKVNLTGAVASVDVN